jgi:hypothetical protein
MNLANDRNCQALGTHAGSQDHVRPRPHARNQCAYNLFDERELGFKFDFELVASLALLSVRGQVGLRFFLCSQKPNSIAERVCNAHNHAHGSSSTEGFKWAYSLAPSPLWYSRTPRMLANTLYPGKAARFESTSLRAETIPGAPRVELGYYRGNDRSTPSCVRRTTRSAL